MRFWLERQVSRAPVVTQTFLVIGHWLNEIRLGRSVHSQLALVPMPDLPHTIVSIALGQDHSLALTSGGFILSWGHNRFAQLGYVIEAPEKPVGFGKDDQDVQVSPRRIVGPLKKEWAKGVAAGRMSSACWTADAVWTWGTNAGHLGRVAGTEEQQLKVLRLRQGGEPGAGAAQKGHRAHTASHRCCSLCTYLPMNPAQAESG
jgi:alpha-tubulin suppressor-like RCC1 family protein